MEHLLAPDSAKQINVPYVGTEEFEAGESYEDIVANFKSYLPRKGWYRYSTGDLMFENRTADEIVSSLQTWLYFGSLISVFRTVGIRVQTSDFVYGSESGGAFVRTTRLLGFIAKWTQREGLAEGPVVQDFSNPKYVHGESIREILNWTFLHLRMFCQKSLEVSEAHNGPMHLVELSVMAMAESLCSTLVAIYGYEARDMPIWGPSPVLKDRLQDSGWCVSDSPFFPESLTKASISVDYYFGGYACPRPREAHSGCTTAICKEYQKVVDTKTYSQKHVSPNCACTPIRVPGKAVNVVANQGIPVIVWDGKTITVSENGPQTKYVALSHVWFDGLGNDNESNSMHSCQLSRIQSLVDQLYAERHRSSDYTYMPEMGQNEHVPFWIDTLCVPVGKKNVDLRRSAIRQMADIYRQADRVLVLDSFMLTLSRSTDIVSKYVRIHLSNWHHRLWTLQEGQLARSLFFQFKDGAETFYDMNYPELHLDRNDPVYLCSPVRLLCVTELEAFYRYFEDTAKHHGIVARMRSCAKYLRSRQTGRFEDEPICVATILKLDPGPMFTHSAPEDRMACFYDLVGLFDPRIIFNEHPRLQKDGYRWAPKSFLHQVPDLITMREGGADHLPAASLIPRGGGLHVQFPGFEFYSVGSQLGPSVFVKQWTGGYSWMQWWSLDSKAPWWAYMYKLEIQPNADGSHPVRHPGQRYAVVLPGDLHPDFLPATGIMGIIELSNYHPAATMTTPSNPTMVTPPWTTYDTPANQRPAYLMLQRIVLRYICRVHVSMPAKEAVPEAIVPDWAFAYSHMQGWTIR